MDASAPTPPPSAPTQHAFGEVPGGCWETCLVDPTADYDGVRYIFGYGSLVWKPPCEEGQIVRSFLASIKGYHRRFWQSSVDHRGTPERPGRVVTILDATHPHVQGLGAGDCAGMVYEIKDMEAVLPELDFREKNGYTRTAVDIFEPGGVAGEGAGAKLGKAILYYAQAGHCPAYVGPETDEETAEVIAASAGPSGPNKDYLFNLEQWCRANSIVDDHIFGVAAAVREACRRAQPGLARVGALLPAPAGCRTNSPRRPKPSRPWRRARHPPRPRRRPSRRLPGTAR